MSRIAIVVGVNKPRMLAPLQGAVRDATAFADWLKKQGFEVKSFTDEAAPVTFAGIFSEVERIVEAGTYSQLVIYFAGHGFQNNSSEIWLLSGAPNNPSEAISVEASIMAARESGLNSVVFISDACRSIPKGMQNSRVDGGMIFPNQPLNRRLRPEVDRLFATLPSLVAVEAVSADDKARRDGIFTQKFMSSYRDPPSAIVEQVTDDGQVVEVVTNRKLKERVRELVEDAAFEEMPDAGQLPEFILESVQAYVGRVERALPQIAVELDLPDLEAAPRVGRKTAGLRRFRAPDNRPTAGKATARPSSSPPSVMTLARDAIEAASQYGAGQAAAAAAAARGPGKDIGLSDAIVRYAANVPVHHFETRTGFSVTGAAIAAAVSPFFPAEMLGTQLVRLHPEQEGAPSASVLIAFDNGNGVVLPGLRGYIGHVFVEGGGVANVNYVPSDNTKRWADYLPVRERVEALRAAVAAAAGLGVFHIAPGQARSFANKVREFKVFDPTLGLYAAYAYASAGLESEVQSVTDYMKGDLGCELFDVAMLAQRGTRPREADTTQPDQVPILPFCPMLRQGWSLLAARDAELPDAVRAARDWLLPALWTTFAPDGIRLLRAAIERGDFR
jgi:hypothetical protein